MNTRLMGPQDIEALQKIHAKYYKDRFEFPDFINPKYLCSFIIETDEGRIITGGGLRTTIEATFLSDKSISPRIRRTALYQVLESCEFLTRKFEFPRLYVVTDDVEWKRHLLKVGFQSRGDCLSLNV